MGYFRELPNIEYKSPLANKISNKSYIQAKNLFRRMKIRDDLQSVFTVFNKYIIKDGARPDTVAEELYGKSTLDWVLLISAGIINVQNEWPLYSKELYDYCVEKYRLENVNDVHHYETLEWKNLAGAVVVPKGLWVESDYSVTYYDWYAGVEITKSSSDIVVPVTTLSLIHI